MRMERSAMLRRWTSGGYQLVCGFPGVGDVSAVFLSCFVIEDLVVDDVAASLEVGHDASVGRYAVGWDIFEAD